MATAISEIDLYTSLRDKLGDTQTRDLIQYVKDVRYGAVEEVKAERSSLATKDDLAKLLYELKQELKQEILAARSDAKLDMSNLRADMEKGFKDQLRWVIVLLMGFSSLIVTVIKLL